MIRPFPPAIRDWSKVNLVFDGNSYYQNGGASNPSVNALPLLVRNAAPVSNGMSSYSNLGVSGQTWRNMDGLDGGVSTDVDGAFVTGKINVLVIAETRNQICNAAYTPAQCIAAATAYINDRLAAHPSWVILLGLTFPRGQAAGYGSDQTSINTFNSYLQQVDDYHRANYRAFGVRRIIDYRRPILPNGKPNPFLLQDYSVGSLATINKYSNEYPNGFVHPNDAGNLILQSIYSDALRQVPVR